MESQHVKASNEIVQKTPEVKPKDETPSAEQAQNQQLSSPSSNSSMEVDSDDDDDDDDNHKKSPLHNRSTKTDSNEQKGSSPEEIPASSCVENATQISQPEPTEMKSPAVQPAGYDPNRIPASVFSTKQGNNADWSTNSNESLFSIHLGNNSFSRDYAILFGKSGELHDMNGMNPFMISGELPRLDDWNNPPQPPSHHLVSPGKSSEFGNLPPVMEDPVHEENSALSRELPKVENTSPKKQGKQNGVSPGELPKKPPLPEAKSSSISNPTTMPSPSRLSDGSGHSGSSFAFPVLGSHDSGKNESVKVAPETSVPQPQSSNQGQGSKETPSRVSWTRWFCCFSCWPRFC